MSGNQNWANNSNFEAMDEHDVIELGTRKHRGLSPPSVLCTRRMPDVADRQKLGVTGAAKVYVDSNFQFWRMVVAGVRGRWEMLVDGSWGGDGGRGAVGMWAGEGSGVGEACRRELGKR